MKNNIIFGFILLVAFILRFYQLGTIPNGLQQDETSLGYNSYSILQTGKDEHGVFLPQNFQAFGEYKLPGYIYTTVGSIAIFGFNPFAIRLVSALTGFLSVVIIFFLAKTILGLVDQKNDAKHKTIEAIPYITAFLVAINPWHLQFSRAAFEVMLANFFMLTGIWLLIQGILKSKFVLILLAVLFLVGSIYTYNIARLFTPLLALLVILLLWKKTKNLPKPTTIGSLIAMGLLLIPFLIGALSQGGANSTLGTLITSSAKVQAPLLEFRSYFADWPSILNKLLLNSFFLTLWQYVNNFFAHFSVSYYFINSTDGITSNGTTGKWYIFELPLIIWGVVWLWQTKSTAAKLILGWIIGLVLVTSLTREPPQATRTFFLLFPISFLSGIGLYNLVQFILPKKNAIKYTMGIFCLLFMGYFVFLYFASYYVRAPIYFAKDWRTGDRDVATFIRNNQNTYDKIVIDKNSGLVYTSLLTYLVYPPQQFQNGAIWSTPDSEGFTYPQTFGKFEFRTVDFKKDILSPNTLIVTKQEKKPDNIQAFETIYYPNRPVVINVGQEIMSYPTSDPAYVLINTNDNQQQNSVILP